MRMLLLLALILEDMETLLMRTEVMRTEEMEEMEGLLLEVKESLLQVKESLLQVKERLEWEAERQVMEPVLFLLDQLGLQPSLL